MVLFSIVLSFFCVLIFYCFNKRISVSPKPGMVYGCVLCASVKLTPLVEAEKIPSEDLCNGFC